MKTYELGACLLCLEKGIEIFHRYRDKKFGTRTYLRCPRCYLIFLDPSERLSLADEKERYGLHQNRLDDENYLGFLGQLSQAILPHLTPACRGLDFGCGPVEAMRQIFEKESIQVASYDPVFFNRLERLDQKYDFIVCSETAEHFHDPRKEFLLFDRLLDEPKSYLGIMTGIVDENTDFKKWWYINDPTHVVFYSKKTLEWIATWRNWRMIDLRKNVVIYQKDVKIGNNS